MKAMVFAAMLLACAAGVCAAEKGMEVYPVPPDKMQEYLKRTGGLVYPPDNGKAVVVLDARVKDASPLDNLVDAAAAKVGMKCKLEKLEARGGAEAAFEAKKNGAGAVVLFMEDANAPALSVFPEEAVSVVNLLPLADDEYNVYRRRLVREFWRAVGFALGGYGAQQQIGSAMQPVFSVKELDEVKGFGLSAMQMNAVKMAKLRLGIHDTRPVPYSRAVREGWAPAPTNDIQRAIWEEVNSAKEQGPVNKRNIKR